MEKSHFKCSNGSGQRKSNKTKTVTVYHHRHGVGPAQQIHPVMKRNEKRVRKEGSAGVPGKQTQNSTSKKATLRRVYAWFPEDTIPLIDQSAKELGKTRNEFIIEAIRERLGRADGPAASAPEHSGKPSAPATEETGEGTSGSRKATVSVAAPSRSWPAKTVEQMEQESRRRFNMTIEPGLYVFGQGELSDADCLHCVCKAISNHEAAMLGFALNYRGCDGDVDCVGENLALLSVAKGIATDPSLVKGRNNAEMKEMKVRFRSLPGLLGWGETTLGATLCCITMFFYEARRMMVQKVIPRMADRRKALELAEALVIAEQVCHRDGYASDLDDLTEKGGCVTTLEALTHRLLAEVMTSGATEGGA